MAAILRSRFWNYCFTFIVISTRITCDFASEEEQEKSLTSFYHQKTAVAPPPASRPKIKFIPNDFDLYDYHDVDLYYLIPVDQNKKPPSWNGVSTATTHHQAQNSQAQPCDHGTHSNQVEKPVIFPSHLTYSYDYYEDPDPPGWSSPGWPSEPAPPPPPPPPAPTPGWSWPAAPPPAPPPPTPAWGWQAPAPTPGWPAAGWAWPAEPEPEKVKEKVKEKSKSKNKGKAKDKSKSKAKEKAKGEKEKPDKGKEKVKEVEIKEKIKYVYVKEKEEKEEKGKDKDKGDKGDKDKHKDKDKEKKEKSKPKKKFAAFMKDVWNKFVDVLKFEKYADFDVTGERRLRSENAKNDTEKGQNVLDTLYIPVSIALRWASAYPKVSNGTE